MSETTVKVGTVFYRSWGYDQTNVNFYVVTAVSKTGKTATFLEVAQARTASERTSERVTANLNAAVCANCLSAVRQLVKVTGETVWRHVGNGREECGYREGDTRKAAVETFKRRVRTGYGDGFAANYNSYSSLYEWDGKDKYQTAFGFGH
jgi:hypothetical protein